MTWQPAIPVSNSLTPEQAQRVQALRCAREVIQHWGAAELGGRRPSSVDPQAVVDVAEWIVSGRLHRVITPQLLADVAVPQVQF